MYKCPLITVIVPIYLVEAYLDECVKSILDQTYKNLEIILVDDGSADNCPAMCDAYAAKDSRIVVIHQVNGGLSSARNAGIMAATGEYIGFVDADDWIAPDMYETLYKILSNNDADVAKVSYTRAFWPGKPQKQPKQKNILTVYDTGGAVQAFFGEGVSFGVVWDGLYKTKLVKNNLFEEKLICAEDTNWLFFLYCDLSKLVFYDVIKYYYRFREDSLSNNISSATKNYLKFWVSPQAEKIVVIGKEKFPQLSILIETWVFNNYYVNANRIFRSYQYYKEFKNERKYFSNYLKNMLIELKQKVGMGRKYKVLLMYYCPFIYLVRMQIRNRFKAYKKRIFDIF